jgi:hypothetical protein
MPNAVRVKTSSGWQDVAMMGPPGPQGSMVLIGKYDLAASNIISNIPQIYDHLRLVVRGRTTANGLNNAFMRLNGVSAAGNYDWFQMYMTGTAAPANSGFLGQSEMKIGWANGADSVAGYKSVADILIPGYSLADQHLCIINAYAWNPVGVTLAEMYVGLIGSLARQVAAITSINVFPGAGSWAAGSVAYLYGIGPSPAGQSAAIPLVTSLPASPVDGQEIYFLADATNGVIWHLRYRAASASAYKWEFIGGSELSAYIGGNEATTTLNQWVDLATVGPQITVPLAGDYRSRISALVVPGTTTAAMNQIGASIGATGPGTVARYDTVAGSSAIGTLAMNLPVVNLAAGNQWRMRYYVSQNGSFQYRHLLLYPIRVG